jgi:steroid Delta-isomerase
VAATAEIITATIGRYIEVFSLGDKDGYLGLFAPDATVEDPVGSAVCAGADGIAGFWDGVRGLTPTITLEALAPPRIAAGEAAFSIRAIAEVGESKLAVDIIDVMSFDDEGRITSLRAFWDMADMAPYEG